MKYSSSVNNYRETPYIVSDTFANIGNYTATIKGAIYVARDGASLSQPSIFQANGTTWVAIGGYGIGTDATLQDVTTNGNTTDKGITITALGLSTNTLTVTSLTPKSVPFVGTADLLTEDNTNFVWDNTNKRLGINTNTPGNSLDVHGATTTPIIALNNTAAFQSAISFLNTSVAKWRLANKATTNDFEIYNFGLTLAAINISNIDNRTDIDGNVFLNQSLAFKINTGSLSAPGFTTMHSISGTGIEGLGLSLSTGGAVALRFNSTNNRSYTFPNSDGTVALTTDLSAYLPLAGGTLIGTLNGTIANFSGYVEATKRGYVTAPSTFAAYETYTSTGNSVGYIGIDNSVGNEFNISGTTPYGFNIWGVNNFPMIFGVNNSEKMRIASATGNLLLGSVVDDTVNKLQVTGTSTFSSTINSLGAIRLANNTTTCGYFIKSNSWVGSGNFDPSLAAETTFGINFFTNGSTTVKLNISTTGVITISNLAGTGSRAVIADANGVLSAPVSDQSIKENVQPLQYGLDTIMQLKPVQFKYIDSYKNFGEGLQIGNIAQDVEKIIPEAVFLTLSTGLKGIDYNQFNGIYIKAIQDQQKIIESLIERIEQLENKL